jgi:putative transposase
MARPLRRFLLPGYPIHVIQRGHNKDCVFNTDADHILYLGLLQEFARRHECNVHAYVLMTNHVHLLVSPPEVRCLSKMMQDVNQVFVQSVNRHQNRSGSSWSGRFKACLVDTDQYLITCQRYIELNPVRAGMVRSPRMYPWSSYAANAAGGASDLIKPHPTYVALASSTEHRQAAYGRLFEEEMSEEVLAKIRSSVNRGWPLGGEAFCREMDRLGIATRPAKAGRPKVVPEQGQTRVRPGSERGLTPV